MGEATGPYGSGTLLRLFNGLFRRLGASPVSGGDMCSRPTMNRLENAPSRFKVAA